jgi:uncharacterized RDD family membrane protein YckC/ribosomal protein L40E
MPDNVFCSKCGAQNSSDAQFCQRCGGALWPAGTALRPAQAAAPASPQPAAYSQPVVYAPAQASPYAGFWIRVLAYILDRIVVGIAAAPFYFVLVLPNALRIMQEAERDRQPSHDLIIAMIGSVATFVCIVFVSYWLYEALLTSSTWQGTVGKRVLRLKVTDEMGNRISFGRSTGRFFAKILSHLILWIGFIMVAFTDRKRGLHDIIAGTLVTKY